MRRVFSGVLLGLCAWTGLNAGEESASEVARTALEKFRSDEERILSVVTIPAEKTDATWPGEAEVYLIHGYISYECTRLFRREGRAWAQRVKMTRSWFYSPKEGYGTEEWEVPEADFRRAWEAAGLIREATLTVHSRQRPQEFQSNYASSSHELTTFVRMWAGEVLFEDAVRGKSGTNGVQPLYKLQIRAISQVFSEVVPKGTTGEAFPMADWGPFLTRLLEQRESESRNGPARLEPANTLIVETSLRLLGQMGYVPAREVIRALETAAKAAPDKATWAENMLRETRYAQAKIAVQEKFDPAQVAQLIQATGRRTNPDRDFVQWARDAYFANDPTGYLMLLTADLQNPGTNPEILRESVPELGKRFSGQGSELLTGLLGHASSEVAADAALALLARETGNEAALKTLTRLAANPQASIPPNGNWSSYFGRERALDYLASKQSPVPDQYRWNVARVEQQLQEPWEDGRMVNRLLAMKHVLTGEHWPEDAQIAAYRRTLAGPITKGTLHACEALIKLKDHASRGQMESLLKEIAEGSNKGMSWEEDSEAKYPWADRYEIGRLKQDLEKFGRIENP